MKFNSNNHNKIIYYNFPTFDSNKQHQLPKTFFNKKYASIRRSYTTEKSLIKVKNTINHI